MVEQLLVVAALALAPTQSRESGLELSISAGGAVHESRVIGQPESSLLSCVEDVVRRWGASAFAGARRDTTLFIPLGHAAENAAPAKSTSRSRLALPWGFVQDLAGCRG